MARSISQFVAGMQTQQQQHEQQNNLITNMVNAMNQNLQHQTVVTNVVAQAMTGASAAPPSAAKRQFPLVDTRGTGKPFMGAAEFGWSGGRS